MGKKGTEVNDRRAGRHAEKIKANGTERCTGVEKGVGREPCLRLKKVNGPL